MATHRMKDLKRLREELGVEKAEFARKAALSDETVSKLERGEATKPVTCNKALQALNEYRTEKGMPSLGQDDIITTTNNKGDD